MMKNELIEKSIKVRQLFSEVDFPPTMIQFFDLDDKYTTYLQSIDRQVPNIKYTSNNKFVCGIVLQINGFDYVAPISSKTNKQRTNILIYNGSQVLSSIKFSFI